MRTVLVLVAALAVLAPDLARAQWSDDPIENTRTERRVARDAAFVGAVVGVTGLLITVPLVIATAVDEGSIDRGLVACYPGTLDLCLESYASARRRWEVQLVAGTIAMGVSIAALAISIVTLALVPSPDEPVQVALRVGPGSLSLAGAF